MLKLKNIRTLTIRNPSSSDVTDDNGSNPVDYIRPLLDAYVIFLCLLVILPVVVFEWLTSIRHRDKQI
ncbi:MAG: hypothetical protein RBT38_11740 [Bacteroidales bacterium]|jgi:hypothetical protein|nr:hypothetical protein [Bacteroidales bacterium]